MSDGQTALAKVKCDDEGYWLYHSNKVDLLSMFSAPEEKLWLVVKHYNGAIEHCPSSNVDNKRGIKLEKNSVIKMGRVRLRVRDIDYPVVAKPKLPTFISPDKKPSGLQDGTPKKQSPNSPNKAAKTQVPTEGQTVAAG